MKKIFQIIISTALPALTIAQDAVATAEPSKTEGSTDLTWWLIIATMIVLLIAILLLGNVLIKLTQLVVDKQKAKAATLILLLLGTTFAMAQDPANAANFPVVQEAVKENSISSNMNFILAGLVLLAEVTAILLMLLGIRNLLNQLSDKKEEEKSFSIQLPSFLDNINASVPLEKEKDVLLDHNYDGIRELDNNLPPWWKYGFYLTIVWSIGYLSYYHVMGGESSIDEYNAAMKAAQEQQDALARINKNKVDENNVQLADALGIEDGKSIFSTNCATCHGKLAEGTPAAPNLTDDYWIHGGGLNDVFKSIKYGWSAKGMKAWEKDLGPSQIRNVASYIKSLRGSNPANAKAAEGTLYVEGAAAVAATDSTAAKNDSTSTATK